MILSAFNMVKFKGRCHGNELIDLYQNCVLLTQEILKYLSCDFKKNQLSSYMAHILNITVSITNFCNGFIIIHQIHCTEYVLETCCLQLKKNSI